MSYLINRIDRLIKCCALLLAASIMLNSYAQTTKVNQLQAQLKGKIPDTTRLRLLNELGIAYISVDPTKKFYYANIAKQLAVKLNNGPAIADAYISMGISYGVRSKLDSALYYFSLAFDQAQKSKYTLGMGKSLSDIGFAYDRLDNKQEAIKCYFQALPLLKKANFLKGVNQCYTNIGSLYYDMKQYTLAESYFSQCLKSYTANKDTSGIGYALFTLGNCYQALGQDDKAMNSFTKSLAIREKYGDINGIGLTRRGLGEVYLHKKQYAKAMDNLDTAYKYISSLQDKYEESAILLDKADVYIAMHEYDKAKNCALQALANGRMIRSKIDISESLEKLVAVYKGKNQLDKAFKYQEDYINVLDSIQVEKSVKDVTLSEFSRIRTENAVLAKNNRAIITKNNDYLAKLNQYIIVIVAISVILGSLTFLLLFLFRRNIERRATNKQLLQQQEEIASINRELEALNKELNTQAELTATQNNELERLNDVKNRLFSIISHDVRGPLSTLQSLFGIYHEGDIGEEELTAMLSRMEDTIISTGTFLDNLLEWAKNQLDGILIKPVNFNVNEVIKENIKLFATQTGQKNLKVTNTADENALAYGDKDMISLVIRNLLSNSIKFCSAGDEITLGAEAKGDKVLITVSDTGPGISDADREKLFNLEHTLSAGTRGEKGNRLGLVLVRDMVLQNKGTISFESNPGAGTIFWVELPMAEVEAAF